MVTSLGKLSALQLDRLESAIVERCKSSVFSPVTTMDLFLTEHCTLRCDYCFVAEKRCRRSTWEIVRGAVDFLMTYSGDEAEVNIVFFGGEPLLEFDLMKQGAQYALQSAADRNKKVNFSVTTNGTIMTEEIAMFGKEYGFNYLLSIDGCEDKHDKHRRMADGTGSWKKVMGKNFSLLKRIQGWIGTRMTPCPDTIKDLSADVRTLFDMGVNQFLIGPDMGVDWSTEQLNVLKEEMQKVTDFYLTEHARNAPLRMTFLEHDSNDYCDVWGCHAGKGRVAVSVDGDLYPCARFVSSYPILANYRLGNVYEGFTEVATRNELLDKGEELRLECSECSYKDSCKGGCYAVNLLTSGSLFQTSQSECFVNKVLADALQRIEAADSERRELFDRCGIDDNDHYKLIQL